MKKGVKIGLIAVIVAATVYIALFFSVKVQPLRASFAGGLYQNVPCVVEITSDGTLTVETGTAALHPKNEKLHKDLNYGTAKKTKTRKLSIKERWEINKLTDEIKNKGLPADSYSYGADDAIMFCVLLDEIEYECIYDNPMGNWRVNDLAYKLVELSPIDILEPRNAFMYLLQRTHGDFMLY